jgi:hypothetical protein
MLTSDIIKKFELYVDDGTELSSQEELDLANKVYQAVCSFRPWEFLKKTHSGVLVNGQITLPGDFAYMSTNYQSTDNNVQIEGNSAPKVIFIGANLTPYQIVNFSDRRQYKNRNVCYIDPSDSTIKFVVTPTEVDYEFDYIKVPSNLSVTTSPVFPERFHDIISYGMASDDFAIQLFDKARSYANENQAKYNSILKDMSYWNAMQSFN